MHYGNGREAKNGDKVVWFSEGGPIIDGKVSTDVVSGILYDAVAGNDHCNGRIAVSAKSDPYPNLKECLHADDVRGITGAAIKVGEEKPAVDLTAKAIKMFDAYNAEGPNPGKTWDGKDVPPWTGLNDQVRGKWLAAAKVLLVLVMAFPALALAQTAPAAAPSTLVVLFWSAVFPVLLTGAGGLLLFALAKLGIYLHQLGKTKAWAEYLATFTDIVEHAVAHAEVELKPKLIAGLAGGQGLSAAAGAQLKDQVEQMILKETAPEILAAVKAKVGDGAFGTFLSGAIETAVATIPT